MAQMKFPFTIAIIGPKCTGKTTILNNLIGYNVSETHITRNTYYPFCFQEVDGDIDLLSVKRKIKNNNKEFEKYQDDEKYKFTIEECIVHEYPIPTCQNLLNNEKLRNQLTFRFYDIPGFDDHVANAAYMQWITRNADKFDMVIYVDSYDSLLNRDIDMSQKYFTEIKHALSQSDNPKIILPVFNKAECHDSSIEKRFSNVFKDMKTNIVTCDFVNIIGDKAMIYRCFKNHQSYDMCDLNVFSKFLCYFTDRPSWRELTSDEKNKNFKSDVMLQIEEMKDTYVSDSKFENFLHQFNSLIENNIGTILSHKKEIEYEKIISDVTNDNFYEIFKNFSESYYEAIELEKYSTIECKEYLVLLFKDKINKYVDDSSINIKKKVDKINLSEEEIDFISKEIRDLNNRIEIIKKGNFDVTLTNILDSCSQMCRTFMGKLYSSLLVESDFDPDGRHNANRLKEILVTQIAIDSSIVIKFFEEKILKAESNIIENLFFSKSDYLVNIITVFKGKVDNSTFSLLTKILFKRLSHLINVKPQSNKFIRSYILRMPDFLEKHKNIFIDNELSEMRSSMNSNFINLSVNLIKEYQGRDYKENVLDLEEHIMNIIQESYSFNPEEDILHDLNDEHKIDEPQQELIQKSKNTKRRNKKGDN